MTPTTTQPSIRPPAVAGTFYPADPQQLRRLVGVYLTEASVAEPPRVPKAIIAPHAGYVYSGPVAAAAHARLAPGRDTIHRVVMLGPSHFAAFSGLAVSGADFWDTPLGRVPVDRPAVQRLLELPFVHVIDEAHQREHCLEVHLPFLQVVLRDFAIVPMVVADASPQQVRQALDTVWDGQQTLIVISSDLSHYLDYESAEQIDRVTSAAIEAMRADQIGPAQACGRIAIQGLIGAAGEHGLSARVVDQRNSGDTAGPRDEVVGYGAYVFT